MKKTLYLCLIILMLFSFAACKDNEENPDDEPKEPVVEEVTGKVFENFGVFTGKLVDAKPAEGYLVGDGFTYAGTFEDGFLITGNGVLTHEDGAVNEGTFVNKQLEGWGKAAFADGCVSIGYWTKGALNGDSFFQWPQGENKNDVYYGPWENFVRKGVGYYFFSDGTYYHGTFNDWINGPGTMYWTNGNKWSGEFVGGSPKKGTTGFGVMDGEEGWIAVDAETGAWSWGTEVEGWLAPTFPEDEAIDYHALYSVDADVVDKEYPDFGVFTGKLVDAKPAEGYLVGDGFTYAGTFEDGFLITGNGVLTHEDGAVNEGTFVNKQLEGWGKAAFADGCVSIGYWTKGALNGDSFFQWPQGENKNDVYYGPWENFVRKGVGYYFFSDGTYYHGTFNDWINGPGTMYWTNGNKWSGEFVGGSPKKGTTGFGVMDGEEGWIAVDAETGAWSWGTDPNA